MRTRKKVCIALVYKLMLKLKLFEIKRENNEIYLKSKMRTEAMMTTVFMYKAAKHGIKFTGKARRLLKNGKKQWVLQ